MNVQSFMTPQEQSFQVKDLNVKVCRVNDDVARVLVISKFDEESKELILPQAGECMEVPDTLRLFNKGTERDVKLYNNEWFITWAANYELVYKGFVCLRFENPRQIFVYNS